jgi:ADP-heptose:LPS heptosyltransferase
MAIAREHDGHCCSSFMSQYSEILYHKDCRHFRGDIPCLPNKREGVHCQGCPYYDPIEENVLIIKLGAAGDVIRTTPLLWRLREDHPRARLWWLTYSPDLVPASKVDRILKWSTESLMTLESLHFSRMINLDKDAYACGLANRIQSARKEGYLLGTFGETEPANERARDKFITGIFDDVSESNRKSYPEEMFEICGYQFAGERYILEVPEGIEFPELDTSRPVIGMNTGAGIRWTSRLWDVHQWAELANHLLADGYNVILLGGPDEDPRNREIQALTKGKAQYLGTFSLKQFIALVDRCSLIVTGVTMAMHIALALQKKIVLMNNIFNRHEFGDLYGLGEIVESARECKCYFRGSCVNPDYFCLDHLPAENVFDAVRRVLGRDMA